MGKDKWNMKKNGSMEFLSTLGSFFMNFIHDLIPMEWSPIGCVPQLGKNSN